MGPTVPLARLLVLHRHACRIPIAELGQIGRASGGLVRKGGRILNDSQTQLPIGHAAYRALKVRSRDPFVGEDDLLRKSNKWEKNRTDVLASREAVKHTLWFVSRADLYGRAVALP